jgi:hypothetical protein
LFLFKSLFLDLNEGRCRWITSRLRRKWNEMKCKKAKKKKKIETATTAATDCTAGELIVWRKGSALTLPTYLVCCHLENVGFGFVKEWFVWKPGNKTYRIDEKGCFLINLVIDCILFKTALKYILWEYANCLGFI